MRDLIGLLTGRRAGRRLCACTGPTYFTGDPMKRRLAMLAAIAALLLPASSAIAADPTTTGTWYFHGPQTFTTTTTTTPGTPEYKSAVRPPINADGTSNFPAKRGVIPVQFDLLAAPTTTTVTTKTYDPPVWKSLGSDGSVSYAGLNLNPDLTFNDIQNLSAVYNFTTGDCFGGSLRWTIYAPSVTDGLINVYYGDPNNTAPSFQSCSGIYSETGKNLMSQVDVTLPTNRFELGNSGSYVTYADILAATNGGTDVVTGAQLTLDSGWKADQRADVSNVTVNDNTWIPKTVETTTSTTVTGNYAKTCTLPAAELRWAKNDATPTGAVNEAESIQPKDTGQYYRQVDCKYIYNLDVTSLSGQGTYTVWVRIGGLNIQVPATFDLR
jgi:hypothetical protein